MQQKKRCSGFTLMELMIVLAIIAIGASVAGFSIRNMLPDLRLSAAARDLKSDMNSARLRAIKENREVCVLFDMEAGGYDVLLDDGDGIFVEENETLLKSVRMPKGVTIEAASFGNSGALACFNSRGIAGVPGTASLANSDDGQRNVAIAKTGRVSIEKL